MRFLSPRPVLCTDGSVYQVFDFDADSGVTQNFLNEVQDWCEEHFGRKSVSSRDGITEVPWMMDFRGEVYIRDPDDAFHFKMRWC